MRIVAQTDHAVNIYSYSDNGMSKLENSCIPTFGLSGSIAYVPYVLADEGISATAQLIGA
jgi:hypothetical protein